MPKTLAPLLTALVALLLAGSDARAQSVAPGDVDIGAVQRRIGTVAPKSGPPGEIVRVAATDMPVITPVRVGIGAPQAGFEAFQELLTGDEGEFDVTVTVPDWARWDRVHLFIVFDIYFRPIALSDAFHVTNEDGLVRRTGQLLRGENGCMVLRDVDGVDYALTGERVAELPAGAGPRRRFTLDARLGAEPVCGLGNVLEIVDVVADG